MLLTSKIQKIPTNNYNNKKNPAKLNNNMDPAVWIWMTVLHDKLGLQRQSWLEHLFSLSTYFINDVTCSAHYTFYTIDTMHMSTECKVNHM